MIGIVSQSQENKQGQKIEREMGFWWLVNCEINPRLKPNPPVGFSFMETSKFSLLWKPL